MNIINPNLPIVAVIPAAGIGSRMQAICPKQYLKIGGLTILEHTINALLKHPRISQIIIAISPEDDYFHTLPLAKDKRIIAVNGGGERADSVLSGLVYVTEHFPENTWALVHDAARPCLSFGDLDKLIQLIDDNYAHPQFCGGILATPVRDTMKRSHPKDNHIQKTVERTTLWHALTPQFFPAALLKQNLENALSQNATITDEASAMEFAGYEPLLVKGRADNIKVTQPEDFALAEFFLSRQITSIRNT
ncbi:2-C-methyl-D-erythritol 4-phosphate cytidylyltransferase [Proteus hauseri]|uniref:2-C-methyl-D-erythritol 4-phosphate cytidylyltransferase n=1 Tax=Proteus hauseri TaxID=183417 RepID=UPI0032DB298B